MRCQGVPACTAWCVSAYFLLAGALGLCQNMETSLRPPLPPPSSSLISNCTGQIRVRHLIASSDIDDIDRVVRELARKVCRQIVPPRLEQQKLRLLG
jgi:hypothetical protein